MSESYHKKNLSNVAIEYIRERIASGEFPPGSHITETRLAEALSMSRGPVREALQALESEGMLDHTANKGYRVVFLTPKEAWEVFFLRGHLEKIGLELVGGHIPPQKLIEMEKALDNMKLRQDAGDINGVVRWDDKFHLSIVSCGGIDRLVTVWQSLSPLNLSMFYSGLRAKTFDFTDQWEKHVALFDTLRLGDLDKSVSLILSHYVDTGKSIYKSSL